MTKNSMENYWLPLVAVLSAFLSLSGYAQEAESKPKIPLSKKANRLVVDKIVPSIRHRDDNAFLQLTMPLIRSSKPGQVEIIDQICLDRGVVTATERFTELVVGQMRQGINPRRATSNRQLSRVILNGLADDLEKFDGTVTQNKSLRDPLKVPTNFHESERLFWDLDVLHKEFDTATKKLQLAGMLVKKHQKSLDKLDDGQALVTRFTEIENRLKERYRDIDERAAELRLERLLVAHQRLTNPDNDDDFELLFTSAMALEQDSQVLAVFFEGNDSISREALTDINLPGEVAAILAAGRKAHEDVTKKANLFRTGLNYWVRGRYGSGPLTAGLVKSPRAMSSLKAMELLSMPKVRDQPISNYHSEEETTPGYDRRHFYTWAAEHRAVTKSYEGPSKSDSKIIDTEQTGSSTSEEFW